MRVAIVFETHTGITAAAAEKMAEVVRVAGHECTVENVLSAEPAKVSGADAVCVGAWTKGWFIIMQHPSPQAMESVPKLSLSGKPVVEYMWSIGHTIRPNGEILEGNPAEVKEYIPVTAENYEDYYDILFERAYAWLDRK